jgi:hypothetical protein
MDERLNWLLTQRKHLEVQLREAEIIVGIVKRHLAEADRIIASIRDRTGIKLETRTRKQQAGFRVPPEMDVQIAELWKTDGTLNGVARTIGISRLTVKRRLLKMGLIGMPSDFIGILSVKAKLSEDLCH